MSAEVVSRRGRLPEPTGDARADRWREHRVAVRAELVEATLRAIDDCGPDLSIDDILKSAGVSRPKLYRFFEDKEALFAAVSARVQEMVIEQVVPHFTPSGALRDFVRSALVAYVDLVDERPNLFRFLVGSHFTVGSAANPIDGGRRMSDALVELVGGILRTHGGNGDHLEYSVDAQLGAVALSVLRWLNEPTITKDALVDEMTTFLWGALAATAAARGVILDPDGQPPRPTAD